MKSIHKSFGKSAVALGLGSTVLAVFTPTVIAQEVQSAIEANKNEQQIEVIEVSGVRSSLENALNVKREAASIVDAISATDIDALPALDLGESLQAIPGIQLNTDTEGRQSTISLRGLGSGFVKTTAFGQTFASPAAVSNLNAVGSNNPFAAFEPGVFDGVTVVKTPTADLQAGGVAGIVDMKLQQALSKKSGKYSVSLGGRYEELTGEIDPNFKMAATKHLIKDKLAVGMKLSASGQTFRRDTFNPTNMRTLIPRNSSTIEAYREKWNIPEDAQVRVLNDVRNVSEFSDGDRISVSANIEYRPIDDLKLGAHILYSKRDLDDGTKEETQFNAGLSGNTARSQFHTDVRPDMDTAPVHYLTLESADPTVAPTQVYGVGNIEFDNGAYTVTNRKTTFFEESKGAILYGEYVAGDWVMDGKVTHSEAENQFQNIGIYLGHNSNHTARFRGVEAPTGINGTLNNGQGNLDDIVVSATGWDDFTYNDIPWDATTIRSSRLWGIDRDGVINDGKRLSFGINGRVRDITRDLSSAEFNTERYTEFGFGNVLRVDSIKFGARYSKEDITNIDQLNGPSGVNTGNISDAFLSTDVLSHTQNSFFNGNIPGTFDNTSGWQTFDNNVVIAALQEDLFDFTGQDGISHLTTLNRSGFWDRQNATGLPINLGRNFDAKQEITAAYVTADFSGELGAIPYTGNLGVRFEKTDNTFDGYKISVVDGAYSAAKEIIEDDYAHVLPMANVSFELSDDVVLRTAYYEGIIRPNLSAQLPSSTVNETNNTVRLDMPGALVQPYEAVNYDVSLEWYNREGSAFSIGFFKKEITNLFEADRDFCPVDDSDPLVNEFLGGVQLLADAESATGFGCYQSTLFTPEYLGEGEPGPDFDADPRYRNADIRRTINNEDTIEVEGFEIAIQQKLDFLPYPWNGFGGVINYTKLKTDDTFDRVSPESYNLIGYWENDGISIRLAYNWRDDYEIFGANAFLGDRTKRDVGRLDLATSYKVNKQLKVFLKAYNLTDEVGYEFVGDERILNRLTYTGRIAQLSVNYTF